MKSKLAVLLLFATLFAMNITIAQDYPYYKKDWRDTIPKEQNKEKELETVVQQNVEPQSQLDVPGTVRASINIGLGVMDSPEINNFIREDLAQRGITILSGSSDMNAIYIIGGQIGYTIRPQLQLKGILDFAVGISSTELVNQFQSEYINYTATRLSVGAGANYYFGRRKISPYLGLALLYHSLSFEEYKGSTVGPRGEAGAAFNFSDKFKMEAFFQADIAETEAKRLSDAMTIDFSSINLGARFLLRIN